MGVLGESWCFCNGLGKSEKTKSAIFSGKGPSMARISTGTGFLIHRNLLLTTHAILPSVAAAEAAEIQLQNGAGACLFPNRFFITSSILDLTIVGLDIIDGDSNPPIQQSHYLKTSSKPNLDLGSTVYLLGYTNNKDLTIGEGKVVIATDNLIKVSPDGLSCTPGSAGFDIHGNLSFMICDPMKLATSPNTNTKSSSTSSSSTSSWKKNPQTQFGIPIPIIYDWLNQHWEGSFDDLVNKPKLPIIRLMSTGQKSEHSCSSFTKRRVFKTAENENDPTTPSSENIISKPKDQDQDQDHLASSSSPMARSFQDETPAVDQNRNGATHLQGIPTPEIFDSPKLTSAPFKKPGSTQIQLLDINFPPRIPVRKKEVPIAEDEIVSTGSVNGAHSEVQSCASPIELPQGQNGYNSEGEITMYSAETAESRNFPSPKDGRFHYQQEVVGRSQSCVNYNRLGSVQRNPICRRDIKGYSQGTTSQRSNDYYSPTVSSIMKKQNNSERQTYRPQTRSAVIRSSPKWTF